MATPDDLTRAQRRQDQAAEDATRAATQPHANDDSLLGSVVSGGAIPTSVPAVFLADVLTPQAPEVSGAVGSSPPSGAPRFPFIAVGPRVPVVGDLVVARRVSGGRWAAATLNLVSGTGGLVVSGCPCAGGAFGVTPGTLYMHVTNPDLNGQNFRSCTLVYQDTPDAYLPLAIGPQNHYSQETFADTGTGDEFRFLFRCESGYYLIRKVYAVSIFGSPYLGTVLYKWLIGFPGNKCHKPPGTPTQPFSLLSGQIYPGGDDRTVVTVTES